MNVTIEELLKVRREEDRLEGLKKEAGKLYYPGPHTKERLTASVDEVLARYDLSHRERSRLRHELLSRLGHGGGKETAAREREQRQTSLSLTD
jgi:hypothetical protein